MLNDVKRGAPLLFTLGSLSSRWCFLPSATTTSLLPHPATTPGLPHLPHAPCSQLPLVRRCTFPLVCCTLVALSLSLLSNAVADPGNRHGRRILLKRRRRSRKTIVVGVPAAESFTDRTRGLLPPPPPPSLSEPLAVIAIRLSHRRALPLASPSSPRDSLPAQRAYH